MSAARRVRAALWASAVLNALGAVVFLEPALGTQSRLLPVSPPPIFAAQLAWMIALFGGAYVWMARQPVIPKPLIVVGALGKLGFFMLFAVYAALGHVPAQSAAQALPDLLLAVVFLDWARRPGAARV